MSIRLQMDVAKLRKTVAELEGRIIALEQPAHQAWPRPGQEPETHQPIKRGPGRPRKFTNDGPIGLNTGSTDAP